MTFGNIFEYRPVLGINKRGAIKLDGSKIILGEWYIFKVGVKVYCGHCIGKDIAMVTFETRTEGGSWQKLSTTYSSVLKKADINAEAKADYIDFLLDIKDFEELQKLFPNA